MLFFFFLGFELGRILSQDADEILALIKPLGDTLMFGAAILSILLGGDLARMTMTWVNEDVPVDASLQKSRRSRPS